MFVEIAVYQFIQYKCRKLWISILVGGENYVACFMCGERQPGSNCAGGGFFCRCTRGMGEQALYTYCLCGLDSQIPTTQNLNFGTDNSIRCWRVSAGTFGAVDTIDRTPFQKIADQQLGI